MSTLERAIQIAAKAHKGQLDKAGKPYILHPLRMLFSMDTNDEMIVAVLHDVAEDSSLSLDSLREEGFSEVILNALECLTRRHGELYDEYINRVITNSIARKVKLVDLEDNMDIKRIPRAKREDLERIRKYHRAWLLLSSYSV